MLLRTSFFLTFATSGSSDFSFPLHMITRFEGKFYPIIALKKALPEFLFPTPTRRKAERAAEGRQSKEEKAIHGKALLALQKILEKWACRGIIELMFDMHVSIGL
jgi:hypothetical protein